MIEENVSLKPFNTFGIDVSAKKFIHAKSLTTLEDALTLFKDKQPLVLSGGSNILLTNSPDHVILIDLKGIEILRESSTEVLVEVQAGEVWHDFVIWAISHGFGGIENLSLIPGKVGATPIQNIGAYGVELADVLESCNVIYTSNLKRETLKKDNCKLGYRDSVFKQELKNKCVITNVCFKLTKNGNHKINTSYKSLQSFLETKNILNPTIQDISDTVIQIRSSKLPDPKDLGNGGSFFKNIIVSESKMKILLKDFPQIHFAPTGDQFKISSAWLIESCGFKGARKGNVGVHKDQSLVLVNYGDGTGSEVLAFSENIIETVKQRFGLTLEREVSVF